MGFHLIYLTPAFFVDVTEAWVYANRVQRIITMLAGMGLIALHSAHFSRIFKRVTPSQRAALA